LASACDNGTFASQPHQDAARSLLINICVCMACPFLKPNLIAARPHGVCIPTIGAPVMMTDFCITFFSAFSDRKTGIHFC
jgi:hypothetical protein